MMDTGTPAPPDGTAGAQEALYIPEGSEVGGHPAVAWPWLGRPRPKRVWTLLSSEKPELPIVPRHHHNAFLETYVHDWDLTGGADCCVFHYHSRLSGGGVWLLLEW